MLRQLKTSFIRRSNFPILKQYCNVKYRFYHKFLNDSIERKLQEIVYKSTKLAFPDIDSKKLIEISNNPPHGDYSTNISFLLSRKLKKRPDEIASAINKNIKNIIINEEETILQSSISDKGFITFKLSDDWISMQVLCKDTISIKNSSADSSYLEDGYKRNVIIDYGSPNMSKEFHVGHLRSIMIGESLLRILKHQGHDVEGVSHVGDFGTPIGLVITEAINQKLPWAIETLEGKNVDPSLYPTPSELSDIYKDAKANSNNEAFMKQAHNYVLDIQKDNGSENIKKIWKIICEVSRKGFDDVYNCLNVSIPEKGESFYGPLIPSTLNELIEKGLVTESNGALVANSEDWSCPLLVQKSDSSWLYGTTDLAAIRYRLLEKKYDTLLYLVDTSQSQHFQQVFDVAKRAGWINSDKIDIKHVNFGVVLGPNGQKLSSRDGTPMKLKDLLDDAVVETRKSLLTVRSMLISDRKNQDTRPLSLDEKLSKPERGAEIEDTTLVDENAPIIAYNAIKYFELSQTRNLNYSFSFQAMLNFKGNTSFYIIYAYARIRTMMKKASREGINIPSLLSREELASLNPEMLDTKERELALKLLQFPDVVRLVENTLMPHHLSSHMFNIAKKFHSFYENCRVLGSPKQEFRIRLCLATEQTLSLGLELLNVQVIDHV